MKIAELPNFFLEPSTTTTKTKLLFNCGVIMSMYSEMQNLVIYNEANHTSDVVEALKWAKTIYQQMNELFNCVEINSSKITMFTLINWYEDLKEIIMNHYSLSDKRFLKNRDDLYEMIEIIKRSEEQEKGE